MLHLMCDAGHTGESFRSWQEAFDWFHSIMGRSPKRIEQRLMKNGKHFLVGSRWYTILAESESIAEVA